ncbi:MAG: protein translocase subunit SecF [Patescibacteria group bacterium]|nr:protein translocase subunit SecF [Patescibacteria group bacterium]
MFDLIGKRNIFFVFSGIILTVAVVFIIIFGFNPAIDLTGGTEWHIGFKPFTASSALVAPEEIIKSVLSDSTRSIEASVKSVSDGSFIIRLPAIDEKNHQSFVATLKGLGEFEEKSFSSIGPTIGSELRRKSIWAIILVLVGISLYIAWAFRKVSQPVKSWKYGVVTLLTLVHDVCIPAGLLALLGELKGIEIDTNFIVALLVVMGFSVHDTIVVFDRIRENLLLRRGRSTLAEIINFSVNETFVRSINTSLTLIFVLLALLLVGPASLFYFVLTILVGTVFGTYSSIFVASPLLFLWSRKRCT